MLSFLFFIYFLNWHFFFYFTGRTNCANVQQSSFLLVSETESVTIQCSHDDNNLDIMLWYQQRTDSAMALIGYSYNMNEPNNEDGFKDRFKQIRQSTTNGNLTIFSVLQTDSAVYFCAAREHSATDSYHLLTKNPKHPAVQTPALH